ncbi:UTP--glucose-1-phosphate uridylyltransferase GalU [Clostridiaceae bacterium HSG29]|nr:UTP--glucose-1-phosphate uridylyltransferase GalU [Clostridiaceae bacterium HSG29]
MKVRKAVIPAAGFGTRFLPATKAQPKEMLPIVDKPTIQYNVEELINAGIEEILIITSRNKEAIMNHFDKTPELDYSLRNNNKLDLLKISEDISNMVNIHFVRQKEAKGLGHAILCAKSFIGNEPFAVLLGDDVVYSEEPCIKQLIDVYNEYNSSVVGVQQVKKENVSKYGIVDGKKVNDRTYELNDMVEKPDIENAPSNMAILGRYVLTPEIFEELENTKKGKGGEIQLTDGIKNLNKKQNVYAYDFEGRRYDAGNKLGYMEANVEYALRHDEIKDDFKLYLKELISKL